MAKNKNVNIASQSSLTAPDLTAGTVSLAPQSTGENPIVPYQSYNEYFADNPEALAHSMYLTDANPNYRTTTGVGGNWGEGGNPYQYRNEYNKYLDTLPSEYQTLGNSNITNAALTSGAVTGVYDPLQQKVMSVGPNVPAGTVKGSPEQQALLGSSHSLDPEILNKMWR